MVVRAVWFVTLLSLSARMQLVVKGVVLLFFPSVRIPASILMLTIVTIGLYEVLGFPFWALLLLIVKYVGFSPEVLPIVSIDAGISGMSGITVGAPYGLKVEYVEVSIFFEFVE